MNGPEGHYAERNKPGTEGQVLHDSTCMRDPGQASSQRQDVEWPLPGGGGEGGVAAPCLMGAAFQFRTKRVLETDGGDGCTTR